MISKPLHQITRDDAYEFLDLNLVPPVLWGRDHFQTLIYLETVCVEKQGRLEHSDRRMRTKRNAHATRLQDNRIQYGHDDWDCLNDFVYTHLIEKANGVGGDIRMTDLGWRVAAALRRHQAEGKHLNEFRLIPFFEPKVVWYLLVEYGLAGEVFEEVRGVFDSIQAVESYLPTEVKNSYGEMAHAFSAYIAFGEILNIPLPRLDPLSDQPYFYRRYDREGKLIPSGSTF